MRLVALVIFRSLIALLYVPGLLWCVALGIRDGLKAGWLEARFVSREELFHYRIEARKWWTLEETDWAEGQDL